jgi:hypothetical protein
MQRGKWLSLAVVIVLALVAASAGAEKSQAQNREQVWGLVADVVPSTANLTGVFMLDQNNAWVSGAEGSSGKAYRLRFADGRWTRLEDQTGTFASPALSIVAVSDSNVWVVGRDGLLAHRGASGWRTLPSLIPGATLNTIQMLGTGDEGWAGGVLEALPAGRPVMLRYRNGTWVEDPTVSAPSGVYRPVNSLHFAGRGGYAVGINQIWRHDGTRWVEEPAEIWKAPPMCAYVLTGVRAIDEDEAWATGVPHCSGPPVPRSMLLHRVNGTWQEVLRNQAIVDDPLQGARWFGFRSISFTGDGFGLVVGGQAPPVVGIPYVPFIISYRADGRWHYERTPDLQSMLQSVSQSDAGHALAVGTNGVILSYGYGPGSPVPTATPTHTPIPARTPLPTDRVADPNNPLVTYFEVPGHTLMGGFRDYWNASGGLQQFGYPITEEFQETSPTDGKAYVVQYFERARFEWHPENRPPYDVLLGLLGRTITKGRENEPPFHPTRPRIEPGYVYFQPNGHNMAPEFAQYWRQHGGLPVYGYPISEAFMEVSPTDGKQYLVQYFERNRLEYHPELPDPYRVSLGLLGVQILKARGWIQ